MTSRGTMTAVAEYRSAQQDRRHLSVSDVASLSSTRANSTRTKWRLRSSGLAASEFL